MNGMMNGNGMGSGFFGFGFIGLTILVAIIFIVIWMMRPNNKDTSSQTDSLEALKKRLADGEISEDEYDRLRKKIEK
ncbi:SHOCT domain-containing protein [Halobacillus locisalis]|uniref:SHOCT domain-containing protein n=1 Tax=Halobacillus locisalis TaxID=220753 RepID=A0A838CVN5_9BACI|nr:SHOCT domain-containing protein [Halobacillus locisalis]MBA2175666.1 SHOCT domain-containing protein [Halobacillus locisalis]